MHLESHKALRVHADCSGATKCTNGSCVRFLDTTHAGSLDAFAAASLDPLAGEPDEAGQDQVAGTMVFLLLMLTTGTSMHVRVHAMHKQRSSLFQESAGERHATYPH
jgi:hypothetical protein